MIYPCTKETHSPKNPMHISTHTYNHCRALQGLQCYQCSVASAGCLPEATGEAGNIRKQREEVRRGACSEGKYVRYSQVCLGRTCPAALPSSPTPEMKPEPDLPLAPSFLSYSPPLGEPESCIASWLQRQAPFLLPLQGEPDANGICSLFPFPIIMSGKDI